MAEFMIETAAGGHCWLSSPKGLDRAGLFQSYGHQDGVGEYSENMHFENNKCISVP